MSDIKKYNAGDVAQSSGHDERELDLYTIRTLGLEDSSVKLIADFFNPGGVSSEGYTGFRTATVFGGLNFDMTVNKPGVTVGKYLYPQDLIDLNNDKQSVNIVFIDPFKKKWYRLMNAVDLLADSYRRNLSDYRIHFAYNGITFYMNLGDKTDDYVFKDDPAYASFIKNNVDKIVEVRNNPKSTEMKEVVKIRKKMNKFKKGSK